MPRSMDFDHPSFYQHVWDAKFPTMMFTFMQKSLLPRGFQLKSTCSPGDTKGWWIVSHYVISGWFAALSLVELNTFGTASFLDEVIPGLDFCSVQFNSFPFIMSGQRLWVIRKWINECWEKVWLSNFHILKRHSVFIFDKVVQLESICNNKFLDVWL